DAGRGDAEVRWRAVHVVFPEVHAARVPGDSPGVPPAVHPDRMGLERGAFRVGVDRGPRRPLPVAVPLHQVDFPTATRIVIGQPPGRPHARTEAAELYAGLQVVPMAPRHLPLTKPPKYPLSECVARRTRLDLPSRNTFSRLAL